jgi:hypothetical protein
LTSRPDTTLIGSRVRRAGKASEAMVVVLDLADFGQGSLGKVSGNPRKSGQRPEASSRTILRTLVDQRPLPAAETEPNPWTLGCLGATHFRNPWTGLLCPVLVRVFASENASATASGGVSGGKECDVNNVGPLSRMPPALACPRWGAGAGRHVRPRDLSRHRAGGRPHPSAGSKRG